MAEVTTPFPILRTKLHRPPVNVDLVPRPALLAWLKRSGDQPLTLVSAPAGTGKTTLVLSWLATAERPTAWLALDEQDDDLVVFLTYVIAAIQSCFPDACQATRALLHAPSLPPQAVLGRSLSNDLEALERDVTLVLDDYHVIHDMAIHNLLNALLRHPPRPLHLVVVTRRDPPLGLATLRGRGQVTDIRQLDLRFSVADTAALLQQMTGAQVDEATAAALVDKTEGWVTGIRLAVLSLRHQGDLAHAVTRLPATLPNVTEYLMAEVLAQQPPEIQDFLVQTSILHRFCDTLCDAVRGEGGSAVRGLDACVSPSQAILERVYTANLFLIPLSHESQWYRYHHLFQAFLQTQLARRHRPEEIAALRARASRWCADQGFIEEAIQHALVAGDTPYAVQMVEAHRHDLMNHEQWHDLERLLRLFPPASVAAHPELLLLQAWVAFHNRQLTDLVAILHRVDSLLASYPADATTVRRLQGEVHSLRSNYCGFRNDMQGLLLHAQQALERIPPEHAYARGVATTVQCLGYQMTGNLTRALEVATRGLADDTPATAGFLSLMLSTLCFVYWAEADLFSLQQTARQGVQHAQTWHLSEGMALAQYCRGIVLYQRNDLAAAATHLAVAAENLYMTYALYSLQRCFVFALVHQSQGCPDQARDAADLASAFVVDIQNPSLMLFTEAFEAELALRQGRLADARHWALQYNPEPLQPMYMAYVPQLTLAKVWLTEDTPQSRQKVAALLDRLEAFFVAMHNTRFRIDVLALQALLHDAEGDEPAALDTLTDALTLAEPGGFIRVFVDLGPPMADLLQRLRPHNGAVAYIDALLAAFGHDAERMGPQASDAYTTPVPSVSPQPADEPLTTREIDILELLGKRLQDKEIAAELGIAPTTVKTHLKHLYQKLRVGTRRHAVTRAQALGLLPGR